MNIEYVIDDGTRVIPLKNTHGDTITEVKFRTTDIGIIERAQAAQKKIVEILSDLKGITINPDGSADDDEGIRKISEATARITETINDIFGDDVCTQLFRTCNPFSPVGGKFFAERVVTVLVKIVDDEITRQQKEIIAEYTGDIT